MNKNSNWLPARVRISFKSFSTLLLIFTGVSALFFVVEAVRFLPVVGDNMYPEAGGPLAALQWVHGLPLYEDYRQAPYHITPFPPLWYAFLAVAAKLGALNLDSLTLLGRILNLLCLFGVSGLGYLWNRRLGLSPSLALLMPAFYLSFPILVPWAVTARPDFPALFLAFLALYWAGTRSSTAWLCLTAVLSALAFLVRHNAVAVPVAVVLWLVWTRRWKHAGLFCALWAVVVGPTLLVFQRSSHGFLMLNLSGAKFGKFAVTYIRDVLGRLLDSPGHGFVIALFAFATFAFLQSWSQQDKRVHLAGIYLLVSFGLAIVGSAAAGAAENHYLEPALAMAMLVPFGLARLEDGWSAESPLALFAIVFIAVLLLPSLDVQRSNLTHQKPDDMRGFLRLMKDKQVFTDIPYLAARTSSPQMLDLASLVYMEKAGGNAGWSASLTQALRLKKYELVILSTPVDTSYIIPGPYPRYPHLDYAVQKAIGENYGLCFQSDTSYVYGPLSTDLSSPGHNCPSEGELFSGHPAPAKSVSR
jgi:hypothetical protein